VGYLQAGRWVSDDRQPTSAEGEFTREGAQFHGVVRADGSTRFGVEAGRYHLYVAHACPWAHRTWIARTLLGLEDAVSLTAVHPLMLEDGWVFSDEPGLGPDPILGARTLWEVYAHADPRYSGRVTTPVLWDKQHGTIVCNESREILRMMSTELARLGRPQHDLCPPDLRDEIDAALDRIYAPINNGVYRAGFATSQAAHERAVQALFAALDREEARLGEQRFLCGDRLTEADICLFTTLLRFDPVYATHFKCNLKRLVDHPNLLGFAREIYQLPGVAATCDIARIKQHYYGSHRFLNPRGIVPLGFPVDLEAPPRRGG
jgi:glutathionyl-hydroquinone reductase